MSKRFERNQRRKMRQEIERLAEANTMSQELATHIRRKLEEARYEIEEVKRIVGEKFVGFEPQMMKLNHDGRYPIRMPMIEAPNFSPNFSGAVDFAPVRDIPLHVMLSRVNTDKFTQMAHIRVELAGGVVGYAISERAIYDTPIDVLTDRLSREMARALVRDLRKLGAR